jgi:hypothetical protein
VALLAPVERTDDAPQGALREGIVPRRNLEKKEFFLDVRCEQNQVEQL